MDFDGYSVTSKIKGRLWVTGESDVIRELKDKCMAPTSKGPKAITMADNVVNRMHLGLPFIDKIYHDAEKVKKIPKELRNKLHPYQIEAVEKMLTLRHPFNAEKPGFGKTIETIVWLRTLCGPWEKKILIVVPKIILNQWKKQLNTWWPEQTHILINPKPETIVQGWRGIYLINYEQLISKVRQSVCSDTYWDFVILDEAHRIKNRKSKVHAALCSIGAVAETRCVLTGSPTPRYTDDLFGIYKFLNSDIFGVHYWPFVEYFCNVEEDYFGKKITGVTKDPDRKNLLIHVRSLTMVRTPFEIVPTELVSEDIYLEMYPEQEKIYKEIRRLAFEELDKRGVTVKNGMDQAIKLQEVTSCPELFGLTHNIKMDYIEDYLANNPDQKVVVFSKFKEPIKQLEKRFAGKCVTIHGDKTSRARAIAQADFVSVDGIRILGGTIATMSEAIDGLQHVSSTMIFIDKDWGPEKNNQAIRRLYRDGQVSNVSVLSLVIDRTVDTRIGNVNVLKLEDIWEVIGR